jgi:hypothetical protein
MGLAVGWPAVAKDTVGEFEAANSDDFDDSSDDEDFEYEPGSSDDEPKKSFSNFDQRIEGQPAAAFFHLEGTYQTLVDADVDGYALRGVLVLNLLGVGAKFVRYPEVGAVLTW